MTKAMLGWVCLICHERFNADEDVRPVTIPTPPELENVVIIRGQKITCVSGFAHLTCTE